MGASQAICSCIICKSGKCGTCHPEASLEFKVLDHGLITSEYDIMKLNIINWNGLNGSWSNPGDAMRTIASWFINRAHYTLTEINLRDAPERDDFPGWKHVGNHERYGRLYWNWFHHNHDGELIFSDAPDFFGELHFSEGVINKFYGDIGQVSVQAMACTQKRMKLGDIWISILGDNRQVIIEPMEDLQKLYENSILKPISGW